MNHRLSNDLHRQGLLRNFKGKTEKLTALISFLRQKPTATLQEQAEFLGMTIENVKRTYHDHLYREELAVQNPVFTHKVESLYQKCSICIETTFQGGTTDSDGKDNYQAELLEEIIVLMSKRFGEDFILSSADIYIGLPFDIMITFQAKDVSSIIKFVIADVRTRRHVLRTHTGFAGSLSNFGI